MPVILAPTKPLLSKPDLTRDSVLLKPRQSPFRASESLEETKESDEADPPFIQFIITTAESKGSSDTISTMRIRAIQMAIQEF